jgi:hypothetical protein
MAIMYNRPMTKEEEERMMMAQSLKNNNMMMADNNTTMPESQFPADYTTGPTLIPPDADMSQYNVIDPSSVVRESEMLNQGMNLDPNSVVRQPETISPMGTPMTPEQIDEEIMRLQMLKNQMMMGN